MSAGEMFIDPDEIDYWLGDGNSAGGNCPAACKVPGGAVVQGKNLDARTRAAVQKITAAHGKGTGSDETAVFIPQNIIDQIRSGDLG